MTMSFGTTPAGSPRPPFRIVVLGPFAAPGVDAPAKLHRVDGSTFDDVMAELGGPWSSYKALRPEALAKLVPGGPERLAVRQTLAQLKNRKIGAPEALEKLLAASLPTELQSSLLSHLGASHATPAPAPLAANPPRPESPPPSDDDDPLSGLLSMVDVPGQESPKSGSSEPPPDRGASAISAVIGSIGRSGTPSLGNATPAGVDGALALIDRDLSARVQSVLDDPRFRVFEAAWRGLRFLVSRVDFREGITVEIVPAGAGAMGRIVREIGEDGGPPISLLAFAADVSPADLVDVARAAEAIESPALVSLALDTVEALTGSEEWRAFREAPCASWVGVAVNAFLLRLPFGAETEPVKDFAFEEAPDRPLWGSPALAVAALAAMSQARTGWPTSLEGRERPVSDLPVRAVPQGHAPTQHLLRPEEIRTWIDDGMIPLAAALDRDQVFLAGVPSAGAKGPSLLHRLVQARLRAVLVAVARNHPNDVEAQARKQLSQTGVSPNDIQLKRVDGGILVSCRIGSPVLSSTQEFEIQLTA